MCAYVSKKMLTLDQIVALTIVHLHQHTGFFAFDLSAESVEQQKVHVSLRFWIGCELHVFRD